MLAPSGDALFRAQCDAACFVDSQGIVLIASDSLQELFLVHDLKGRELASLLGNATDFTAALDWQKFQSLPKSHVEYLPVRLNRPGLSALSANVTIKCCHISDQILYSCSFLSTGSEHAKQLDVSQRLKLKAIEAMPYALHAMTADGSISVGNPASLELFQKVEDTELLEGDDGVEQWLQQWQLFDDTFENLVPLSEFPVMRAIRQDEGILRYGIRMPDKSDRVVEIDRRTLLETTEDGQRIVFGGVIYATDVSAEIQRTQTLTEKVQTADSASQMKTTYVSTISHETRTGVAALTGLIDLLLCTDLVGVQLEYAQAIKDQIRVLLDLVSDVLDFNKIEAGRLEIEMAPFDLRQMMQETAKTTRYSLAAQRPHFLAEINIPEDCPPCIGDRGRIRQVLQNMLSNAIKFAKDGHVLLRVNASLQANDVLMCKIEVIDDGRGATAEQLAQIFQPYTQADASTSRLYGGTGIGLTICRKLLHEMQGEIALASPGLGQGCTATVTLPLPVFHAPPGSPPITNVARSPASRRASEQDMIPDRVPLPVSARLRHAKQTYHILVAEDNPILQKLTGEMISRMGFTVVMAADGQAAIEQIAARHGTAKRVALVLMDVTMPRMSGVEATARIRQISPASELPIIALTASVSLREREDVFASGFQAYFLKPAKYKVLENEILAQLYLSEQQLN